MALSSLGYVTKLLVPKVMYGTVKYFAQVIARYMCTQVGWMSRLLMLLAHSRLLHQNSGTICKI